jgi:hypothetical protein
MTTTSKALSLAGALALAALASAQAADSLPKEFHGHWCIDPVTYATNDVSTIVYKRKVGKRCPVEDSNDDNSVRISAQRLDWRLFNCKLVSFEGNLLKCRNSIDGRISRSEMKLQKGRLFKTDLD